MTDYDSREVLRESRPARQPPAAALFVYGTLLAACRHPLHARLRQLAAPLGKARVAGRLYDLGAYPGLVLDAAAELLVLGELYEVREPARLFEILDDYEGTHGPDAEYRRISTVVESADLGRVTAFTYEYIAPTSAKPEIIPPDYSSFVFSRKL